MLKRTLRADEANPRMKEDGRCTLEIFSATQNGAENLLDGGRPQTMKFQLGDQRSSGPYGILRPYGLRVTSIFRMSDLQVSNLLVLDIMVLVRFHEYRILWSWSKSTWNPRTTESTWNFAETACHTSRFEVCSSCTLGAKFVSNLPNLEKSRLTRMPYGLRTPYGLRRLGAPVGRSLPARSPFAKCLSWSRGPAAGEWCSSGVPPGKVP